MIDQSSPNGLELSGPAFSYNEEALSSKGGHRKQSSAEAGSAPARLG